MKQLLDKPAVYRLFLRAVGADRCWPSYVSNHTRPRAGDKVLDIGCGPADILDYLPKIDYYGFDINASYIESAKIRFGERGHFYCCRVSEARECLDQQNNFDVVLATGILHHLADAEALELFRIAWRTLRHGGRLVTLDGCYVDKQSLLARLLLSKDRGRFVRTREGYVSLARQVFDNPRVSIRSDLLWIPYTHIVLECVK